MSKRITYLQRRADLPAAEFSRHWRHGHAEIAVELPGTVGYRQNHVLPGSAPEPGAEFTIDGIVELWFTSAGVAQAGISSEVSDRLIEDEPRFLSGLTGAPVAAPNAVPLTAFALWFLGWSPNASPLPRNVLDEVAEALGALPGSGTVTTNTLEPSGALLVRHGLQQMPALPACAVSTGFETQDAVQHAEHAVGRDLASLAAGFTRVQVLTAEVIPIIEPTP